MGMGCILYLQYRQRHSMLNHCDRPITHLGDLDIFCSI